MSALGALAMAAPSARDPRAAPPPLVPLPAGAHGWVRGVAAGTGGRRRHLSRGAAGGRSTPLMRRAGPRPDARGRDRAARSVAVAREPAAGPGAPPGTPFRGARGVWGDAGSARPPRFAAGPPGAGAGPAPPVGGRVWLAVAAPRQGPDAAAAPRREPPPATVPGCPVGRDGPHARGARGEAPRVPGPAAAAPLGAASPRRHLSPWPACSRLVVVGASTGGPPALRTLLAGLPADLAAGLVVVQHMPPGFTAGLAARLDQEVALAVREAVEGDVPRDGLVLLAPGGRHLAWDAAGQVVLSDAPPVHGVRPAIDVTLDSLPLAGAGPPTVVILTGMGNDGARGASRVRAAGGVLFCQDEGSSVVWGMPRAAHEAAGAMALLPPAGIAERLVRLLGRHW